jgi:sulfopyruvate decarboxylase TPP-binding subunit
MLSASKIHDALKEQGITHIVGLTDNLCRVLFQSLMDDPEIEVINVSREGEAFALASGLHLGGKKPVVLIQNTGFLESGDAFRGTSWNMKIPQVILMGYRGYKTLAPEVEKKDSVAEFTEPTLKAWNIPHYTMLNDADIRMIDAAFEQAQSTSLPVAVLVAETTV